MSALESGSNESGPKPVEDKIETFAEFKRQDAFVRRWVKYLSDRNKITPSENLQINADAAGRSILSAQQAEQIIASGEADFLEDVRNFRDTEPDKAGYVLARLTKLKKVAEHDYLETHLQAEAELSRYPIDHNVAPSVSYIRARAILLGMQRDQVQQMDSPTLNELVAYTKNGGSVGEFLIDVRDKKLENASVLLDEADRKEYLAAFSEGKRREVSVFLDMHLSKILHSNAVSTEEDKKRVATVEQRASAELKSLMNSPDFIALPQMLKFVCLTLAELDSINSVHFLQQAGEQGLDKDRVLVKGDLPQDRIKRWARFARILKTQSDVPSQASNAGMLSMKYLAMVNLPDRLFGFFIRKMVETGFMTNNVLKFPTSEPNNGAFLHQIITKFPSQFNTIIDTIADVDGFSVEEHGEQALEALAEFHTLVPVAFESYITGTRAQRREMFSHMKEIRSRLYQNVPSDEVVPPEGNDLPLAEHIYLATDPVNMSFERFSRMLSRLRDKTGDLEGRRFPQEGYAFELKAGTGSVPKLREGETLDTDLLNRYTTLFDELPPAPGSPQAKALMDIFVNIAKGGTLKASDPAIAKLYSLIHEDKDMDELRHGFSNVSDENAYQFILEMEPFLEDPDVQGKYAEALERFLAENPALAERLAKECADPKRVSTLKQRITSLTKQGFQLGVSVPDQVQSPKDIAELMTASVFTSSLLADRRLISKEKKKFVASKDKRDLKNIDNLKAYISKSMASFFARASVGICTFEDVSAWNEKNYFHINIVENDEDLVANIQAFVIEVDGSPSLLLRGINPNSPFEKRIDAGVFCEEILKIAETFRSENDLEGVYISEQAEWHALSNRPSISRYMIGKYVKPEAEITLLRPMVMSHTDGEQSISKIYKVS